VPAASGASRLSDAFVGVFAVAILGSAAEHATRRLRGYEGPHGPLALDRDRLERAGGPVRSADLAFGGRGVPMVRLAVLITEPVAGGGRSD